MMGTSAALSPSENIACMHFMEKEVLPLAKRKGFAGILTVNTSPLTQQLACYVNGYKALHTYQINKFISHDGSRPFEKSDDTTVVIACYKDFQETTV